MEQKQRLESVELRMILAEEKLKVAGLLLDAGYYNDVVSKAYYAMFYATRAILLAIGQDPHRHTGAISLFSQYFVKPGMAEQRYSRMLARAQQLREECDYVERKRATKQEAQDAIANAQEFVQETKEILRRLEEQGKIK